MSFQAGFEGLIFDVEKTLRDLRRAIEIQLAQGRQLEASLLRTSGFDQRANVQRGIQGTADRLQALRRSLEIAEDDKRILLEQEAERRIFNLGGLTPPLPPVILSQPPSQTDGIDLKTIAVIGGALLLLS